MPHNDTSMPHNDTSNENWKIVPPRKFRTVPSVQSDRDSQNLNFWNSSIFSIIRSKKLILMLAAFGGFIS